MDNDWKRANIGRQPEDSTKKYYCNAKVRQHTGKMEQTSSSSSTATSNCNLTSSEQALNRIDDGGNDQQSLIINEPSVDSLEIRDSVPPLPGQVAGYSSSLLRPVAGINQPGPSQSSTVASSRQTSALSFLTAASGPGSSASLVQTTISTPTGQAAVQDDIIYSLKSEDYELGKIIGFGSSAVVYVANYKPAGKTVSIKSIDLDQFERNQIEELRKELQVMNLCKHPNLLNVKGSFVVGSKLYIITPYLSAGSCLDIMKTGFIDGLDEQSIVIILKQALQGLDYLHKNGLIHRDVKAGNLLVDDDGIVKLADFGVSSSLYDNERHGVRKTFVGTPCWIAPEVVQQVGYNSKADIWSFGITALELAHGRAPFAKYPPMKVLLMTLQNDPPTLDRTSSKGKFTKTFKEMIDSCLQKDPTKRPTSEKLLQHAFFKHVKKKIYLVDNVIKKIPPVAERPHKEPHTKEEVTSVEEGWDFDTPVPSLGHDEVLPDHIVTETSPSGSEETVEPSSAAATPALGTQTQQKKGRFVVDTTVTNSSPSNEGQANITSNVTTAMHSRTGSSNNAAGVMHNVGLGVDAVSSGTAEVRKGRFQVIGETVQNDVEKPAPHSATANLPAAVAKKLGEECLKKGRFEVTSSSVASPTSSELEEPAQGQHNGAVGPSTSSSRQSSLNNLNVSVPLIDQLTTILTQQDAQRNLITELLSQLRGNVNMTNETKSRGLAENAVVSVTQLSNLVASLAHENQDLRRENTELREQLRRHESGGPGDDFSMATITRKQNSK